MGQYFHPTSLTQRAHLEPHDYDNGMKLMEHSWLYNKMLRAICYALQEGEAWYKHRIIWVGDYAGGYLSSRCKECIKGTINYSCPRYVKRIVGECDGRYSNIYNEAKTIILDVPTEKEFSDAYYIKNHNKNEYVDTRKLPDIYGWIVHPLPVLTAVGNGLGSGDYTVKANEMEYVGVWAGDHLSVDTKQPKKMKEIKPNFKM